MKPNSIREIKDNLKEAVKAKVGIALSFQDLNTVYNYINNVEFSVSEASRVIRTLKEHAKKDTTL